MGLLFQPDGDPSRVYYGTDTRAQSLLVGAVLAMLLLRVGAIQGRIARPALQTAGLGCALCLGFLWSTTSEDSALLYRGGFLFLAIAVAVVIAAAVQPKAGPLGRALSLPPLRALGLISYGVYLWHWPVYLVLTPGRTGWDGYGLFAARVAGDAGDRDAVLPSGRNAGASRRLPRPEDVVDACAGRGRDAWPSLSSSSRAAPSSRWRRRRKPCRSPSRRPQARPFA